MKPTHPPTPPFYITTTVENNKRVTTTTTTTNTTAVVSNTTVGTTVLSLVETTILKLTGAPTLNTTINKSSFLYRTILKLIMFSTIIKTVNNWRNK